MSDNVLQGFFVMFGELKVKCDGACFDVTGSPAAFHAAYFIPRGVLLSSRFHGGGEFRQDRAHLLGEKLIKCFTNGSL